MSPQQKPDDTVDADLPETAKVIRVLQPKSRLFWISIVQLLPENLRIIVPTEGIVYLAE